MGEWTAGGVPPASNSSWIFWLTCSATGESLGDVLPDGPEKDHGGSQSRCDPRERARRASRFDAHDAPHLVAGAGGLRCVDEDVEV